jgi:hypothetical protein
MYVNITIVITKLIFFSGVFLLEIMGVKGMWILQVVYEGTDTLSDGLYMCVFASLCYYDEK